jgi:hypothetical protein
MRAGGSPPGALCHLRLYYLLVMFIENNTQKALLQVWLHEHVFIPAKQLQQVETKHIHSLIGSLCLSPSIPRRVTLLMSIALDWSCLHLNLIWMEAFSGIRLFFRLLCTRLCTRTPTMGSEAWKCAGGRHPLQTWLPGI